MQVPRPAPETTVYVWWIGSKGQYDAMQKLLASGLEDAAKVLFDSFTRFTLGSQLPALGFLIGELSAANIYAADAEERKVRQ